MLFSARNDSDTFGGLFSVAYTERSLDEEGHSTVRWQNGAGFQTVAPATGYTLTQVNNAFRPRIPRYDVYTHEQERLGLHGAVAEVAGLRHKLVAAGTALLELPSRMPRSQGGQLSPDFVDPGPLLGRFG